MIKIDVNFEQICSSFYCKELNTEDEIVTKHVEEISLKSITKDKSNSAVWICDPHRHPIKYWITQNVKSEKLPTITELSCWWCRHSFDSIPIGCPLYFQSPNNFEVEGIFCSFPCTQSYILKQNNIRYVESSTLLLLMYTKMFEKIPKSIPPAPTWKILESYGGHLNIDEFRSSFGRLYYRDTINVQKPLQFAVHELVEESEIV